MYDDFETQARVRMVQRQNSSWAARRQEQLDTLGVGLVILGFLGAVVAIWVC